MLKVLIVDDEAVVRRGIVLGIDWASLGCAVVGEAANGEEGLAAAERYSPNLIITDVRMPHMDGIEMMRVLRERGGTRSRHRAHRLQRLRLCPLGAPLRRGGLSVEALPRPGARRRHRARAREGRGLLQPQRAGRSAGAAQGRQEQICAPDARIHRRALRRRGHQHHHHRPFHRHQRGPSEPCVQKGGRATPRSATSRSTASTWRAGSSPTAATRSTRSPAWSATAMSPTSARPSKSSPVSPLGVRTAAGGTRRLHKKVRNIPDKLSGLSQHFAEMPA